jgi:hypothetical protein
VKRQLSAALGILVFICALTLGLSACTGDEKGKTFTSTVTNSHTHIVLIPDSDYARPPDEKVYTLAKANDGHNHKIVLRKVDFINMSRGISVTRPTSNGPDGHSHEITVK